MEGGITWIQTWQRRDDCETLLNAMGQEGGCDPERKEVSLRFHIYLSINIVKYNAELERSGWQTLHSSDVK